MVVRGLGPTETCRSVSKIRSRHESRFKVKQVDVGAICGKSDVVSFFKVGFERLNETLCRAAAAGVGVGVGRCN